MKSFYLFAFLLATAGASPPATPSQFGQVNGHVICGDTDAPGRFASVQLISEKPEQMGGPNLATLTGIDGSFSLEKVPPGTYYIVAQLPGYQSPFSRMSMADRMKPDQATLKAVEMVAEKIVVAPDQAARVEVRLERGSSLNGSVRYDDGSPAPGVTPILISQQKDGKWADFALSMGMHTDDRGRFRLYGLPPGKYAVKAMLPTIQASMGLGTGMSMHGNMGDALVVYSGGVIRERDVKPVEVGSGDEVDGIEIVFPLSGLHTIAGIVVAKSDNHPVNSGAIALLDSETETVVRTGLVDREGNFRLNYVPEGQYTLQVTRAADTERPGSGESENEFTQFMNAKTVKSYDDAEQEFTLKSDQTTMIVPVSDHPGKPRQVNSSAAIQANP